MGSKPTEWFDRAFPDTEGSDKVRVSRTKDGMVQLRCGDVALRFTPAAAVGLTYRLERAARIIQLDQCELAMEIEADMEAKALEAERREILTEAEPVGHA